MKVKSILNIGVIVAGLATGLGSAWADDAPPPVPATPAAIGELIAVQSFRLDQSYEHEWRFDRQDVRSGYLMVIEADPALVLLRQVGCPVLFVGHQTAEVVATDEEAGRVVMIVPAELEDSKHADYLDLDALLIWYGEPALPEAMDFATIREQRDWAERAGIEAVAAEQVADARGTEPVTIERTSKSALLGDVATLIREHLPAKADLADEFTTASRPVERH